ncbi:Gamma carbonic anhydrase 1, mitochondrial [Vitis vinifera]|uniref:Gamma carbonic anhydrase 1, mitochondrial n=1 Tax=Vitis vinifera TaxID=29760 RepID=A0A438EVU8_VITVI|nr:Gamma carbonic anhydrase 1, mitochondrial [Vitis vinifera]
MGWILLEMMMISMSALVGVIMKGTDRAPVVAKDAFVAPTASVIGDVKVGQRSSIWNGCVLSKD